MINRVPRLVKQGVYNYDMDSLMYRMDSNLIQCLLGDKRSNYFDWMVSYDEYIEYQFLLPKISRRSGRVSRSEEHMNEIMDDIKKHHPIPRDDVIQINLLLGGKFHPQIFEEIRGYLQDVHKAIEDAIHFADERGFSHLTRLIRKEWLPGNILRELSEAIRDVFMKMEEPFIESEPWGIGKETMDFEVRRYIDKLCKDIERQDIFDKNLSIPSERMRQIYPSLIAVFVLSSNLKCWLTPMREVLHQIIIDIFKIQVIHWKQRSEQSRKKDSIQKFLAAENLEYKEWDELKLKLQIQPYRFEHEDFSHLYHACALGMARLIDIRADAEFLISLIQCLAIEDMRKGLVLPYIRGVIEDVIVKKKMSHKSGKKAIAEGLMSVQYMEEFSEVLERVLKRWEII